MSFQIRVDSAEVTEALDELDGKATAKVLQRATKKAATFLAQRARPKAPVGKTRRLRKSITARAAKRDKPGSFVTARAPHRHLVQQGTADRFTRSGAFRGRMTPNPFIAETADQYDDQALRIAEAEIEKSLDLD